MDSEKSAIIAACRMLLRPIASLLLKGGMTWREFSLLSKSVFVEVATRDYGIDGRPTNISRVSLLTGIGRKEVKRLRDAAAAPAETPVSKSTDATRVLSGWHQDPDFLDAGGEPRELTLDEGPASFEALCDRYAGDIPHSAMLKELIRVGAVEERNGRLRALSRYYMPVQSDPQWLLSAGSFLQDLGNNINHNIAVPAGDRSWFLGRATNPALRAADLPAFHAFLERQGEAFLEAVDDWLTRHAAEPGEADQRVRAGVGLFAIQGDNDDTQVDSHDQD